MTDLTRIRKMHLRHYACNQDDREYMGEPGFLNILNTTLQRLCNIFMSLIEKNVVQSTNKV